MHIGPRRIGFVPIVGILSSGIPYGNGDLHKRKEVRIHKPVCRGRLTHRALPKVEEPIGADCK